MPDFKSLNYTVVDHIARIELNRPKQLNSLNAELRHELLVVVRMASKDESVRVIVLSGAGKSFCAGADLREVSTDDQWAEDRINSQYKPFLMAIEDSPKPVIAAVRGAAAGIGSSLVMICDLVVMSETAYLFQAFSAIGLIPDGGASWHLTRALGPKRAYEVMLTGERMRAEDCRSFGLVNKVVPDQDLESETDSFARLVVSKAPLSMRYTKEAVRKGMSLTLSEAISLEARLQNIPRASADHAEGKAAFFEKRAPVWKGR